MYLGREEKDWSSIMRQGYVRYYEQLDAERAARKEKRNAGLKADIGLEELQGSYEDKMYGEAQVTLMGKKKKQKAVLTLMPAKDLFTSELEHWEGNSYKIKWKDDFLPWGIVTFKRLDDGKVGFTIDLKNPDFHFFNLNFKKSS